MTDESDRYIGTLLEYEAPFEVIKNEAITAGHKNDTTKQESSNEKNEKVCIIISKFIDLLNISAEELSVIIYVFIEYY